MPERDDPTPPEDDSTVTAFPPDRAPERIGPYKILEKIGEGGMGVVYLAEQEAPLRRRVALKVVKPGMDSKQVLARFEAERQSLALMNHPGVAKVFDAGSTGEGRPYFVMEHVAGLPITDYCDKHLLDNRQRLELFNQVCEAIQHAHQKGIIHRDIKPSNVLVALVDGSPQPKVIDFGVAKATQQQLTEQTLFTQQGVLIGTPEYMSPEQAEVSALGVDTRSDVYSLGVLLYEILTGALPFDPKVLRQAALQQMQQIIRETDPPKPSTRIQTMGDSAGEIARRRRSDVKALQRLLRGDLDWITLKALEKDPAHRYASASEFAADLRRHIAHEPVHAGSPTPAYRIRKFVRRHRVATAVGALLGVTSALGLSGLAYGIGEKSYMQQQLNRSTFFFQTMVIATIKLQSQTESLISLFKSPTFSGRDPGEISMLEIMEQGEAVVRARLSNPERSHEDFDQGARGFVLLAGLNADFGRPERAETLYRDAIELARKNLSPEDPELQSALRNFAKFCYARGRTDQAEALDAEADKLYFRSQKVARDLLRSGHLGDIRDLIVSFGADAAKNGEE